MSYSDYYQEYPGNQLACKYLNTGDLFSQQTTYSDKNELNSSQLSQDENEIGNSSQRILSSQDSSTVSTLSSQETIKNEPESNSSNSSVSTLKYSQDMVETQTNETETNYVNTIKTETSYTSTNKIERETNNREADNEDYKWLFIISLILNILFIFILIVILPYFPKINQFIVSFPKSFEI